jgi:drug/metabolite transporter (DMT)-like permease
MLRRSSPIWNGALLAVVAAVSFGITTPLVELAGRGVGSLTTAALLYLGACLSAALLGSVTRASGPPLTAAHLPRLAAVALFGAAVAPVLLAWGLQRAGATTGSLLLNLEAVFTVLLAGAFYREPLGGRVLVALSLMVLAGVLLAVDGARTAGWDGVGVLAVAGATLAWSLDNTLTRPLSDLDPVMVVAAKGALGATLTGSLALLVRHEPLPPAGRSLVLLACGATGYGLSLRLYLLAQRRIGAARTGSIFAVAPFVGAALAWLLGAGSAGPVTAVSAGLFAIGVLLHLTERHGHRHLHEAIEHDHAHRHDDWHHDHVHDSPVEGEHTHVHRHEALEHNHEHAPDIHHGHTHTELDPE